MFLVEEKSKKLKLFSEQIISLQNYPNSAEVKALNAQKAQLGKCHIELFGNIFMFFVHSKCRQR